MANDPTKYVRQMYVAALTGIVTVYDGMAPADVGSGVYAVIDTSWVKAPNKCEYYIFTVNLYIAQEFPEYGNSVGVDNISDQIVDIMMPMNRADLPTMQGGYSQSNVEFPNVRNAAAQLAAVNVWFKNITLVHTIS